MCLTHFNEDRLVILLLFLVLNHFFLAFCKTPDLFFFFFS